MKNQGGLGANYHLITINIRESLLVNPTVLANDRVPALRYVNRLFLTAAVEDDEDVSPCIAAGMILQTEGDNTFWHVHELQVAAHENGRAKTEGGMVFPKGDEPTVIIENLRKTFLMAPINLIDTVGRLETVMDALLRTQKFLAAKHERNAL